MSRHQVPSAKYEPPVKQETLFDDFSFPHFQQTQPISQFTGAFSPDPCVTEMAHQSSSDSYSSNYSQFSSQSLNGYFDSTNNQWCDFVQPTDLIQPYGLTQSPMQEIYSSSFASSYYPSESQYDYDMPISTTHTQDSTPIAKSQSDGKGGMNWPCLIPECDSHFTRCADLTRHYTTCHNPNAPKYDCPKHRCARVGKEGFTRKDHLKEHLRSYHKDTTIEKRSRK